MITPTMAPQPLLATGRPGFESEKHPQLRKRSHTPEPSNGLNIGKMIIDETKAIKERFIKVEKGIENEISHLVNEAEEEISKLNKLKGYAYNLFHPDKSTVEKSTENPTSNKHNPAVAIEPENIPTSVTSETTAATPATTEPATTASTSAPATEEAKEPRTTTVSLTAPATTSTTTQPTPATTVTAAVTDTTTKSTSEPQTTDSATTRTTISKTVSTTSITPPAADTTYSPSVLKTTNSPATPAATTTPAIAVNHTSSVRPTPAPTIQSVLHESVDSTMIGRLEDDLIAYHKQHPDIDISSLMTSLDQTLVVYQLLYAATVISAFIRTIKKSHPEAAKFYEDKLDSLQSHLKNIKDSNEKKHIRHRRAPDKNLTILRSALKHLIDFEKAPMKEEMLGFFKGYEIARSRFSEMMRLKPAIHDSEFNIIFEHIKDNQNILEGLLKINTKIARLLNNSQYEAIGKYAFEANVLYNHLKIIGKKLPPTIQNDYEKYQYLFSNFETLINRLPNYQTTTRHLLPLQALYTWSFAYDALELARREQRIPVGFCIADLVTIGIAAGSGNILPSLKYMAEAIIYGTGYLRYPFLVKYALQAIYMADIPGEHLGNDLASLGLKSKSLYTEKMTKKVVEIFYKLEALLEKKTFTSAEDLLPRLIPSDFNGNSIQFAIAPYNGHVWYCSLEKTNNGYQLIIHDIQQGLLVLSADSLDALRNDLSTHLTKLCAQYHIPDKWSLQAEQHPLTKSQHIAIIPEDLLLELESIKIFPESELTVGEIMTTPPSELKQLDQKKVQDLFEHYLQETSKDANIARLKDTPKAPHKAHGVSKSAPDSVNKNDPLITQCREVLTALDTPENTPIPDSIMQLHRQIIKQIMEISKQPAPQQVDVDKTPLGADNPAFLPDIHQASAIEAGSDSALISQATSADLQSLINPAIEIIPETLPGITPSQGNSASSQGNSASTLGGRIAGGVASVFAAVTGALVSFKAACPGCLSKLAEEAGREGTEESLQLLEREAAEKAARKAAERAAKRAAEKAAKEAAKRAAKEAAKKSAEKTAEEVEKQVGKKTQQLLRCRRSAGPCNLVKDLSETEKLAELAEQLEIAEESENLVLAALIKARIESITSAMKHSQRNSEKNEPKNNNKNEPKNNNKNEPKNNNKNEPKNNEKQNIAASPNPITTNTPPPQDASTTRQPSSSTTSTQPDSTSAPITTGTTQARVTAGQPTTRLTTGTSSTPDERTTHQPSSSTTSTRPDSTSAPITTGTTPAAVTAGQPTTRSTTGTPSTPDERTTHQPSSSTTSTRPDNTSASTGTVTKQAEVTAGQPTTRSTTGTPSTPDESTTRQPSSSTTSTQPDSTSAPITTGTTQARVTTDQPTTRLTTGTLSTPDERTTRQPSASTTSTQPDSTSASTGTVTTQARATAGQPTTTDERTTRQPSSSTTSTQPDSTSASTGTVTTQARVTAGQPTTPDERTTRQPSSSTTSTQPDSTSASTGTVTTQARATAGQPTTTDERTTRQPSSSTTSTQPDSTSTSTGTVTTQARVTAGQPTTPDERTTRQPSSSTTSTQPDSTSTSTGTVTTQARATAGQPTTTDERTTRQPSSSTTSTRPDSTSAPITTGTTPAAVTAGQPTTRSTTGTPSTPDESTTRQPSSSTTSTQPDSTSASTGTATTQARATAGQPTTTDERTTRQPSSSTTSTQPDNTSASTGTVTKQAEVTAGQPTTRSTTGTPSTPDESTTRQPSASTTSTRPDNTSAPITTGTTQASR